MEVRRVRVNGYTSPLGFALPNVHCSWQIAHTGNAELTKVTIDVATDATFTQTLFHVEGNNLNEADTPLDITLAPRTCYWLRITALAADGETAQTVTTFETGKMDEPWQGQWITPQPEDTFHPVFLKQFALEGEVASARLYIAGLGLYAAQLNNQAVSNEALTPYYSDYRTECQYQTYNVTDLLASHSTENTLAVALGNGWYKGRFGFAGSPENFGDRFEMICELHVAFADGTEQIIASDTSWMYRGSDIELSDIYDGEVLNRLLWDGRENPEKNAVAGSYEGHLVDRYSLPVCEQETMPVKEVIHTPAEETVLDFGQNFAGYVTFFSKLPRGTKVTLDFGEILQDGNFFNDNYRSAKSQFVYVSDGREELVQPHFTFFGFRYARVTGWPGDVQPDDFIGKALYSTMQRTGWIETGNSDVNRLFSNTLWGQRSNSIDFPTDCPQRDERLGWTGDAQVFSGTASYNMETAAFYNKFLHDLRVEQQKLDGILPGVIPVFDPRSAIFASVWGDAATIIPWTLYEHFGDKEALAQHYPMMRDWVDRIDREDAARGRQYLYNFGSQLGDWLALDGRTPQSFMGSTDPYFIGSCYYAHSVDLTCRAARELGYAEEIERLEQRYQKIRAAILEEYFTPSGRLCIDTQTGYIVALAFGIWRNRDVLIRDLRARLYNDCYRLTGGFVGAPLMCRVLADNGLAEEAYYFLLQHDFPGWMHCIDLGATTIWERWNSVLDDGHISGTNMNSLNHYSFGAVVEFLYRNAAGLTPLEPGFSRVRIAPCIDARLGFIDMRYESVHGMYRVRWEVCATDEIDITVEVPFGCTAQVELPNAPASVATSPIELKAGSWHVRYRSTSSPWAFGRYTPFKELVNVPGALDKIGSIAPQLKQQLASGDTEFMAETLESLKGQPPFMGYTDEVLKQLEDALSTLWKPADTENANDE